MKLATSSYCFSPAIRDGRMTQKDCLFKTKELGLDGLEYMDIQPPNGVSAENYAEDLREESERLGLPIVSYVVSDADLLYGCGGDLNAEVERLCHMVDLTKILGAKRMLHNVSGDFRKGTRRWRGVGQVLPRAVEAICRVADYAAEKGICTMSENYGFLFEDSDRMEKLVNAVARPNYGLTVDIGNFVCVGEDPVTAVGRLAPYAFFAHIKDFHIKSASKPNPGADFFRSRTGDYLRGAMIGQGDVPVFGCLSALKNSGYDGYASIEFEGVEDCLYALAVDAENLRRYLGRLEM